VYTSSPPTEGGVMTERERSEGGGQAANLLNQPPLGFTTRLSH